MLHLAIYIETLEYILVPVIPVANHFYTWICGVVVITSALHAEGHEFEPRQNLVLILNTQADQQTVRPNNFMIYTCI